MENSDGWIKLHRSIMDTPEWLAEPFTRAQAWVDLLLLANHTTGYIRRRGILVAIDRGCVGYSEEQLADRWQWSRGKVRRFFSELMRLSRISHKISEKTVQKNSTVSSLIYIINYDRYQLNGTEGSTEDGTENGTGTKKNKNEKNIIPEKILSDISELQKRYPEQDLITRAFEAISSTRKTKRISSSVKLSILQNWNRFTVNAVTASIRTYLEKDYAAHGKDEKYLLGIIRKMNPGKQKPGQEIESSAYFNPRDCKRCGQRIFVKSDLTPDGCVYCEWRP